MHGKVGLSGGRFSVVVLYSVKEYGIALRNWTKWRSKDLCVSLKNQTKEPLTNLFWTRL